MAETIAVLSRKGGAGDYLALADELLRRLRLAEPRRAVKRLRAA